MANPSAIRTRGRGPFLVALLLVLSLIAASCGGDEVAETTTTGAVDTTQAPDTTEAPDTTQAPDTTEAPDDSELGVGVTETSIKVGTPAFRTGPVATDGIHFAEGWEACFMRINDAGGINGRTIEVISDDTQFDAAQAQPIATKLVEQDQVFAIAAAQDLTFALSTRDYLHGEGVPYVGSAGLSTPPPELTTNYPVGASTTTIGHVMGDWAYEAGMRTVAILGHEVGELGTSVLDGANEAFTARGGTVAFQTEFPLTTTDQPALIARARDAEVDGVILNASSQMYLQFMAAANNAGWQPSEGWVLGPGGEDVAEQLAEVVPLAYGVTGGFNSAFTDSPSEEMQLLIDSYGEYFPDSRPWTFSYHSWVGCRLFEQAVEALGDNVTRESLVAYLNGIEEWDTGLGPTLTFTPGESRDVNRGAAVIGIEDGEITQVQEWTLDPLADS